MADLMLLRLHEDGERLVLATVEGTRYTLPITEELRAAVKRDRVHLEHLRAENVALSPREIQSRLRAGQTIETVADTAGVPIEQVERYAGPVLAEQEYVLDQVRASRHGVRETLGDRVKQRLEARQADLEAVTWSATREGSAPWLVTALFEVGGTPRTAQWTYRVAGRVLDAIDDEARWLSADLPDSPLESDPIPDAGHVPPAPDASEETDDLLDSLSSQRGLRTPANGTPAPDRPAAAGDDLPFDEFDPPLLIDVEPMGGDVVAFAPRSEREHARPVPPLWDSPTSGRGAPRQAPPEDDTDVVDPPAERKPGRKGRAKVPSLDEIVFGAKPRT